MKNQLFNSYLTQNRDTSGHKWPAFREVSKQGHWAWIISNHSHSVLCSLLTDTSPAGAQKRLIIVRIRAGFGETQSAIHGGASRLLFFLSVFLKVLVSKPNATWMARTFTFFPERPHKTGPNSGRRLTCACKASRVAMSCHPRDTTVLYAALAFPSVRFPSHPDSGCRAVSGTLATLGSVSSLTAETGRADCRMLAVLVILNRRRHCSSEVPACQMKVQVHRFQYCALNIFLLIPNLTTRDSIDS